MKRLYTPEIDELIISSVKNSPGNIKHALKLLEEKTGIRYGTLMNRWYKVLSRKTKCFYMMTPETRKVTVNQKNIFIDASAMKRELEMKMGIMSKVLKLLEKL